MKSLGFTCPFTIQRSGWKSTAVSSLDVRNTINVQRAPRSHDRHDYSLPFWTVCVWQSRRDSNQSSAPSRIMRPLCGCPRKSVQHSALPYDRPHAFTTCLSMGTALRTAGELLCASMICTSFRSTACGSKTRSRPCGHHSCLSRSAVAVLVPSIVKGIGIFVF